METKRKWEAFIIGLRNVSCLHLTVWLSICRCFVQSTARPCIHPKGRSSTPSGHVVITPGVEEKKKTGKPGCNHIGVLGVGLHSHGLTNIHRHTRTGCYTHLTLKSEQSLEELPVIAHQEIVLWWSFYISDWALSPLVFSLCSLFRGLWQNCPMLLGSFCCGTLLYRVVTDELNRICFIFMSVFKIWRVV